MNAGVDLAAERTLAALDANYLASFGALMSHSAAGEYSERRDSALLCCGAPIVEFNWVHLKGDVADTKAALDHAQLYFEARRMPYLVELRRQPTPTYEAARARIRSAGFEMAGAATPGMALSPIPQRPPLPAGLTIERVQDSDSLDRFARAAFRGFGYPEQAAPTMLSRALVDRPEVQAFVGTANGEAVASSLLFVSGYVAGIYWVGTIPSARRRGFGEALTWAAVEAGRSAGCRVASLQASAMGRPIYARMGFAHVIDYERYLPLERGAAPRSESGA